MLAETSFFWLASMLFYYEHPQAKVYSLLDSWKSQSHRNRSTILDNCPAMKQMKMKRSNELTSAALVSSIVAPYRNPLQNVIMRFNRSGDSRLDRIFCSSLRCALVGLRNSLKNLWTFEAFITEWCAFKRDGSQEIILTWMRIDSDDPKND